MIFILYYYCWLVIKLSYFVHKHTVSRTRSESGKKLGFVCIRKIIMIIFCQQFSCFSTRLFRLRSGVCILKNNELITVINILSKKIRKTKLLHKRLHQKFIQNIQKTFLFTHIQHIQKFVVNTSTAVRK